MLVAMNHSGHGLGAWGLLLVGGLVLCAVVVAIAFHFRGRQADGLSRTERRELGPMRAEILAIVRQTGQPVSQARVAEMMSMDCEDVA